jgi:cytidylate kinase
MTIPQVITIDGPAGSGKSTLGAHLATTLGYVYFDTGIMYRALTLAVLRANIPPTDATQVTQLAEHCRIGVQPPTVADGRQYTVTLDDVDVTWDIRHQSVERVVSQVAAHPTVRQILRARQRDIGLAGHVVMVGRDIGSIVLPEAPLKIFLDVSIAERVNRRIAELQERGEHIDIAELTESIRVRDERDRHVMQPAPDAIYIDGSAHTPDQTLQYVLALIADIPALRR